MTPAELYNYCLIITRHSHCDTKKIAKTEQYLASECIELLKRIDMSQGLCGHPHYVNYCDECEVGMQLRKVIDANRE